MDKSNMRKFLNLTEGIDEMVPMIPSQKAFKSALARKPVDVECNLCQDKGTYKSKQSEEGWDYCDCDRGQKLYKQDNGEE